MRLPRNKMPGAAQRITVRDYETSDRTLFVRALDLAAAEKARQASQRDIAPPKGWGASYARWLLAGVRGAKGFGLVGLVDDRVAGFAFCVPEKMSALDRSGLRFSHPFFIVEFYVFPNFRQTRVDRALLNAIEYRALRNGCDWLRTGYHVGFRWGRSVLRANGFTPSVVLVAKHPQRRSSRP